MMKNRNLKHSPRCVLITRGQRVTEWRNTAESGDQPTNVSITGTSTEAAWFTTLTSAAVKRLLPAPSGYTASPPSYNHKWQLCPLLLRITSTQVGIADEPQDVSGSQRELLQGHLPEALARVYSGESARCQCLPWPWQQPSPHGAKHKNGSSAVISQRARLSPIELLTAPNFAVITSFCSPIKTLSLTNVAEHTLPLCSATSSICTKKKTNQLGQAGSTFPLTPSSLQEST